MADKKSTEHDKKVLHSMGYAQELSRRMSGFSNFAISFSIICILAGGISSFPAAFSSAGSGGVFLIWVLGGVIAMTVAFGMGQIASSYPTAGGLYHWSSHLGGKAWGWATAWFNLVGLICVVSSVDVLLYQVFFRDILLATVFKFDVSSFGYWHQFIAMVIIMSSQALLNHYGIKLVTLLTDFSGYFIFVLATVLIIALFAFSPVALDFSRLFTIQNFTGEAGGNVFPAHPSTAFAFLLGLSFVCYTLTGYDASAHTAEETTDAQVNVPKGMWTAVFWSWAFGLVMVSAFVLTMPSLQDAAKLGGGAWYYMYASSLMPYWLSVTIAVGLVISNYLCALAGMTSCSRMMFAFARDGGLPASKTLAHVSTQYRTPTYAIWASAAFALLSTVYAPYYLVLAVACAVFMYLSMTMPIAAGFFAEGKVWKEKGPFNLGMWSKPNAVFAVLGGIALAITGFFPPNEKVFYLTVAMVIVMPILWFAFVRNTFEGVPEGDKIRENQKKIAEIEAQYKD
jgi:amino acid transporter